MGGNISKLLPEKAVLTERKGAGEKQEGMSCREESYWPSGFISTDVEDHKERVR